MADYLDAFRDWKTNPFFDEDTRKELTLLDEEKDKKEIEDRFYRDLEFGTGGLRGVMGADTNRMNKYTVGKASGLGNLSSQTDGLKTEDEMKSVAIYAEYDTDIWNIVAGEYPSLKSVDEN